MVENLALTYFNFPKSSVIDALERFGSAEAIFDASFYELTAGEAFSEKAAEKILRHKEEYRKRASEEIEKMNDFGIKIIPYNSSNYPSLLAECEDAPSLIFVMGSCDLIVGNEKWITIIGTRSCSEIGTLITDKLIEDISQKANDTVIVSTLSAGIETKAHREAIKRGLRTVGVISTPHDSVANHNLASEILRHRGAIISEYPLGTGYIPNAYTERNRIAAGLSHATVVVEADEKSNTLTTANLARSYNREVFAFPGRVTDSSFRGTNHLIRTHTAELILSFDDIAITMGYTMQSATPKFTPQMTAQEKRIYDCLTDGNEHSEDEILETTTLSARDFYAILPMMMCNDLIKSLPGKMYIKRL